MTYTPREWEDSPSTQTPITADALNRIEAGIASGAPGNAGARHVLAPPADAAQRWQWALAGRRYETARIAVLGDSNIAGSYITDWSGTVTDMLTRTLRRQWDCPTAGGVGWIPAFSRTSIPNTTYVYNQASTPHSGGGYGYAELSGNTAKVDFNLPKGTSVSVRYQQQTEGVFSWAVDDGTATQITVTTASGKDAHLGSLTVPLPNDGADHKVTIRRVSGEIRVNGLIHYDGDEDSGIQVANYGQSGGVVADFTADTYGLAAHIADVGYQVVAIQVFLNDIEADDDAEKYRTDLTNLIAAYDAAYTAAGKRTPSYFIVPIAPTMAMTRSEASWVAYHQVREDLASSNHDRIMYAPICDYLPIASTTIGNKFTNGIDPITGVPSVADEFYMSLIVSEHWNERGNAIIADHIARYLSASSGRLG